MFKFIKQLLCRHNYQFVRNIYGDEILKELMDISLKRALIQLEEKFNAN